MTTRRRLYEYHDSTCYRRLPGGRRVPWARTGDGRITPIADSSVSFRTGSLDPTARRQTVRGNDNRLYTIDHADGSVRLA